MNRILHRASATALAVLILLGLASAPAQAVQAAPAAAIRCSVTFTRLPGGAYVRLGIKSNHPNTAKVHSFIGYWTYAGRNYTKTYIPTRNTYTVERLPFYRVRGWQSGTECASWPQPTGISNLVAYHTSTPVTYRAAAQKRPLRCWYQGAPTPLSGGRWVLRIGSTHRSTAKVHSFKVLLQNSFPLSGSYWRTFIPTGNVFVTPNLGGDDIEMVKAWQSGTSCVPYVR